MLIALACFAGQANAKIWYYDDAMSEEFYESVEEFCMAYVALQGAFDGYQYGWAVNYDYNAAGQLATIRNGFGRSLALAYNASGQLTSVTTPDGRVIGYAHDDQGRLSSVSYPDGKARTFLYENPAFPQALTGILDESGARWGSFSYDEQGRAIGTELAGSAERYRVSYPSAGTATVVDPLGTSRNYRYSTTKDKLAVAGSSLPSGTGGLDAASRVQDANGLITSETDFKGVKTTTTWDVARRLPLSVTLASGTPEAQTVTTQWHPDFSLPVLVTEAGRTTAYTHDDKGNLLSQAITDTASSPNTTRTWQWTWNAQGLAATEAEPNGAVSRLPGAGPSRTTSKPAAATTRPAGWPHYHRRGTDGQGNTIPGQGIGRHRPWETKSTDTNMCHRF